MSPFLVEIRQLLVLFQMIPLGDGLALLSASNQKVPFSVEVTFRLLVNMSGPCQAPLALCGRKIIQQLALVVVKIDGMSSKEF